jgi:hypothetical protein
MCWGEAIHLFKIRDVPLPCNRQHAIGVGKPVRAADLELGADDLTMRPYVTVLRLDPLVKMSTLST